MNISSLAFTNNQNIPTKYTCQGQNINPPLEFSGVPAETKTLVLILHDPDAPIAGGFTHWVIYNMPPNTNQLSENSTPPGAQGLNGAGKAAYTGPCPPSGTHRYHFTLYALDEQLKFDKPPTKSEVEEAMARHVLDKAESVGLFSAK